MLIDKLLLKLDALDSFKGVPHRGFDMIPNGIHSLCFDVAPATHLDTALLASCDGVIGVVVGEFEGGFAALGTREFDRHAIS